MTIQTVSTNKSYGGVQGVYRHASQATGTDMVFSVYVPPHASDAELPVVWYLSGLTCTQRGGVGHTSAPQRLPLQSHLGSSSA